MAAVLKTKGSTKDMVKAAVNELRRQLASNGNQYAKGGRAGHVRRSFKV
jgi:hypothetical protein